MEFEEFKEKVIDGMNGRITDSRAIIHNITKNNGVKRTGLAVVNPVINVSPTIYLEEYYESIRQGMDFTEVFQKIWESFLMNRTNEEYDTSIFTDWGEAGKRVFIRVVNYEKNRELLETVPYIRFLDLAVVYYYIEYIGSAGLATILIHNSHMKIWGVEKEELAGVAYANYRKYFPVVIKSMDKIIAEIMDDSLHKTFESDKMLKGQMYIATNRMNLYGAAALLFAESFQGIAKRWESDLFLLPSSIHEIIIIPAAGSEVQELEEMVREVNQTQVLPEEQLSDHVYRYLYERGEIVMP